MNYYLLILLAMATSSYGLYINSSNLFENTRNISCIFSADLSLSASLVPGSFWDIVSSLTSAWNIFGNISSTLTMLSNSTSVWNATGNLILPSIFDFCFVVSINSSLANGTELISTVAGGYLGLSILENYVLQQCSSANFSPSVTPIGYGICDPFSYQTFTSTLCICSTNNCNIDYATCVASVQANQSPPPPNPPVLLPSVNNAISCDLNMQGTTYINYAIIFSLLSTANLMYNITGVLGYPSNGSTACVLLYNVETGDFFKFPTIYEGYSVISLLVLYLKNMNLFQNYAESSTSVAIQSESAYIFTATSISNLQYFSQILCVCITNNCNIDLASCAINFNLSQITTPSTTTAATTLSTTTVTTTSSPSSSCFSGTTYVRREDGSSVMMRDVQIGDRVLVAGSTYSPILTFLVRREGGPMVDYLQILTEAFTLEITPTHLILMRRQNDLNPPNYLQAAKLRAGDSVFISDKDSNGKIKEVKVIRIQGPIQLTDAYAPLTMEGTLIVNDVLVSCYAEYEYQSFVHFFMFPIRFWHSMIHNSYQFQNLHPYIQFWLNTGRLIHFLSHTI